MIAEIQKHFDKKEMSTKNVSTVCTGYPLNVSIIARFYETS